MPDTSRHDAPHYDDLHTMTLNELAASIAAAGIAMSRRQIMRHCKAGTFDAKKLPATNNIEEWFIVPASVEKGIADIKTLKELRARRDATRPAVSDHTKSDAAQSDMDGHDATHRDASKLQTQDDREETAPDASRYVHQLEKRIEEKDLVIGMLQGELSHRNEEIVRRNERERETNILIRGLQNLVLRLQAPATPTADVLDDDPAMADREVTNTANA
jgi:hypothetical protein